MRFSIGQRVRIKSTLTYFTVEDYFPCENTIYFGRTETENIKKEESELTETFYFKLTKLFYERTETQET